MLNSISIIRKQFLIFLSILLCVIPLSLTACKKTNEYYIENTKKLIENEMNAKLENDFEHVYLELESNREISNKTYCIYNIIVVINEDLEENYSKLFEYAKVLENAKTGNNITESSISFNRYIKCGESQYKLGDSSGYINYYGYRNYLLEKVKPTYEEVYNDIKTKCGENLSIKEKAVIYGFLVRRFGATKSNGEYLYPTNVVWEMTAEDFNVSIPYLQSIYSDGAGAVGEEYRR